MIRLDYGHSYNMNLSKLTINVGTFAVVFTFLFTLTNFSNLSVAYADTQQHTKGRNNLCPSVTIPSLIC